MTNAAAPATSSRSSDRAVAIWLGVVTAMVYAMVVIGGITRLTESGLSMVEWRPLIGWLPPLSEAEWQRTFALYQHTPEYLKVNAWMGLEDFKTIFWWEYIHRLWGRLIGVAFAVPFAVLLALGKVRRTLAPRLVLLFVLGGIQGGIGWWMVASGLVDRPDVSQYRLAAHLSMAFVIFAVLLWTLLDLTLERGPAPAAGLRRGAVGLLHLIAFTVVAGAFVAGLDAGLVYNEIPFMGGSLVPPEYGAYGPIWIDAFENPPTAQFHHRVLAVATLLAVLAYLVAVMRADAPPRARLATHTVAAVTLLQVALGIMTLLLHVPVDLGAAHQAGALTLLGCAVWLVWEVRGRREALP